MKRSKDDGYLRVENLANLALRQNQPKAAEFTECNCRHPADLGLEID